MVTAEPIASLTISVFTRHTKKCPKLADPQWKRCKCRKSIYIRERGKTQYLSAKTRSWEVAERVAHEERGKRDPVKLELQKIAESEAAKRAIEEAKQTSMEGGFDQWLTGMKTVGVESMAAYLWMWV